MPKLCCLCGTLINLSEIPQRGAFDLLPDVLRESLVHTITNVRDQATSRQDFVRQVYRAHSHVGTPGILSMVECPTCARLAVFARASDRAPAFWFQREQTSV